MYEELDEYLTKVDLDSEYWYWYGTDEAREFIEKFTDEDWAKFEENIVHKDISWQIKYSYCASSIHNRYILDSLIKLSYTENLELFEVVIDSLRDLIENSNLEILIDESIVIKVKKLIPKCSPIQKVIFEEFIKDVELI